MFFDINKSLCETYVALNPLDLLNYPAEDVFDLIKNTADSNKRNKKPSKANKSGVIRKKASDNWF